MTLPQIDDAQDGLIGASADFQRRDNNERYYAEYPQVEQKPEPHDENIFYSMAQKTGS